MLRFNIDPSLPDSSLSKYYRRSIYRKVFTLSKNMEKLFEKKSPEFPKILSVFSGY